MVQSHTGYKEVPFKNLLNGKKISVVLILKLIISIHPFEKWRKGNLTHLQIEVYMKCKVKNNNLFEFSQLLHLDHFSWCNETHETINYEITVSNTI